MPPIRATARAHDVAIVGDGIAALTTALALSRRGLSVLILGAPRPGVASTAAGGLLAPSVSPPADPLVRAFMTAARDVYPDFVARLSATTGREIPLGPQGILELALRDEDFSAMQAAGSHGAIALDARILLDMEPALAPVAGAIFHAADSVVAVPSLMAALGTAVEHDPRCALLRAEVTAVASGPGDATVAVADGSRHVASAVVLAAGAWTPRLAGLPRPLPIQPARGQMVAFDAAPLSHVVMAPGGYLVPRGGRTIVGSTLEQVGFDAGTTDAAIDGLARVASRVVPVLARASRQPGWAGLRPVTPDMLPILGPDPEQPTVVYSCGYSKNGILTAPLAADCLAALLVGDRPAQDLAPFSIARFAAR